jgi:hypothetical protein
MQTRLLRGLLDYSEKCSPGYSVVFRSVLVRVLSDNFLKFGVIELLIVVLCKCTLTRRLCLTSELFSVKAGAY